MTDTTRRTFVGGIVWSVPVIAVSATAPAFAASPINCIPNGFKRPGVGQNSKDYVVDINCTATQDVVRVVIDGQDAIQETPGRWFIRRQGDSEAKLIVTVYTTDGGEWTGEVKFPPVKE